MLPELDIDPQGWHMSEKLDGWFLRWDGRQFFTANGNAIAAPDWFSDKLPAHELRGELYAGKAGFGRIAGIIRTGSGWETLRFAVFDFHRQAFPYSATIAAPYAYTVPQIVCRGRDHLDQYFSGVIASGGEGVILRRGDNVRKVKPCADEEATVTGYNRKRGRAGIASLSVANHRGEFSVSGLSDRASICPPPVGACITFRFHGLTCNGIPRNATFKDVRPLETLTS